MTDALHKKSAAKIILILTALIAAIGAGCLVYARAVRGHDFIRITGADTAMEISVVLEEASKALALEATAKDGETVFNLDDRKATPPYDAIVTLRKDGIYRDVRFSVGGNEAFVVAEGFSPKGPLSWNGQDDLHFDWSGRIELRGDLDDIKGPLCLDADGMNICHTAVKAVR